MKAKLVYAENSDVIDSILDRCVGSVQYVIDSKSMPVFVQKERNLELPAIWGGYEIPIRLKKLSEDELVKVSAKINKRITPKVIKKIAKCIIKDSKHESRIRINAAIMNHCAKNSGSGILIFWNRI